MLLPWQLHTFSRFRPPPARALMAHRHGRRAVAQRSHPRQRGAIRGLHFQAEPKPEIKLIRCAAGKIFDVLVDVRPDSPTCGKWEGFELSAENRRQLYVPGGFAHGFQCLVDNCEVFYQMSEFFAPDLARGLRWNDPSLQIHWPLEPTVISPKDRQFPDFQRPAAAR